MRCRTRSDDGYVRFLFGATLPTVVCAPLQVCNLALQPGEVVNNINLGDSVRWKITPSLSGNGGSQTTHLIIKPTDAGLVSSLDIETNKRTYAIKLVSTQASWMPLVAFNYPEDATGAVAGIPPGRGLCLVVRGNCRRQRKCQQPVVLLHQRLARAGRLCGPTRMGKRPTSSSRTP